MEVGREWWEFMPIRPKPSIPDCLVAIDGSVVTNFLFLSY